MGDVFRAGAAADEGGGVQQLRFGRVARDVRPSPGEAAFWVAVETAPGVFRDLLSAELYSFRSSSSSAGGGAGSAAHADAGFETGASQQRGSPRPAALVVDGVAGDDSDAAEGAAEATSSAGAAAQSPQQPVRPQLPTSSALAGPPL
jgi:hypothetical protein